MANRFKDYRAQLKSNKTVVLSDDELKIYSRTANNEGISHDRQDWTSAQPSQDDMVAENTEKERTVLRNAAREQKAKGTIENLSEK